MSSSPRAAVPEGVLSRDARNRARRRRLRIYPELYCPEEDVQSLNVPRALPRGRPQFGLVWGGHWVTCSANVGVFFLGALLMQRVGEPRRCGHLYHHCPELPFVHGLAQRCGCIQNLLQGGFMVQDASGCLHGSETCSSFTGSGDGHTSAPTYVGLCDWCLFERLEEVETNGRPKEDPRRGKATT